MKLQGPRNRFLARPFWRDYVAAYVLIGMAAVLAGSGASQRDGAHRLPVMIVAIALGGVGFAVFLCAVGWSIRSAYRSVRRADGG